MTLFRYISYFFSIFIAVTLISVETPLQQKDVDAVMQQIFDQHLDRKGMTTKILKNSLKVYLNQFDPHRIYLLESEVTPFLDVPEWQLKRMMRDYRQQDFSVFREMNHTIKKAIDRARKMRLDLPYQELLVLSREDKDRQYSWEDPNLSVPFSVSLKVLGENQKQSLVTFLHEERTRYSEEELRDYQVDVLAIYDETLRFHENQYLFQDNHGKALSPKNRENLFVRLVLKALAKSLDSHTTFYSQDEAYDMKVRLEKGFYGTGIVPLKTPRGVIVDRVIEGSPAALNGQVQPDDAIIKVNGKGVNEIPYSKLEEAIVGEKGSVVSLSLRKRDHRIIDLKIDSGLIVINEDRVDVRWVAYGDGIIGKLSLHSFYKGEGGISSENDMRQALDQLKSHGPLKGLVFDLRDNSGGFLLQAVKVAGLFIKNGVIVISKYSNGEEHIYRDMDSKLYYDGPLVVLTSRTTASAAEIVAQALQDYGVALIVGDKQTYGKGTIQSQTVTDNNRNSYFKVTVGKYYTVSGKTPQKQGVLADIIVPSEYAYEHIGEEYLEDTVANDTIPSTYNDRLTDIHPHLRSWYLRYYTPNLQPRQETWTKLLPTLKANSHFRLANNPQTSSTLQRKLPTANTSTPTPDLQMDEAVHILQDMIRYHSPSTPK